MSENHNCGNEDRTKYDAMTTEALEELLRLDCDASSEKLDTEELLAVMEVLAQRSKEKNKTGKTAQESWEDFQRNYPLEHTETKAAPKPWLRRLTAAAAALVLLVSIPVAAHAFSWEDIWNAVAKWAKETFSFVSDADAKLTEPDENIEVGQQSLEDVLATKINVDAFLPTYIPEGYTFKEVVVDETPVQMVYVAFYVKDEKLLKIAVRSYVESDLEMIEVNEELLETYVAEGTEYYIFKNNQQLRAVWIKDSYQCYISGELTIDDIKAMIDSIGANQ